MHPAAYRIARIGLSMLRCKEAAAVAMIKNTSTLCHGR